MTPSITAAYRAARSRLFLLDYDGTISDIGRLPLDAVPTPDILRLLAELSAPAENTVVIVSGRKHEELSDWLGHLPITLVAEHGFWKKSPGEDWQAVLPQGISWQTEPRSVMESAVSACPGSFIENKNSGVVWHYRTAADQPTAEARAAQLLTELQALGRTDFTVSRGAKIIEVQLAGVTKGEAVQPWTMQPQWDFMLIAGDDRTDEDMFAAAPPDSYSIKIGGGKTAASYTLKTPAAFRRLLQTLTKDSSTVKRLPQQ